jgi:hypothetical protein
MTSCSRRITLLLASTLVTILAPMPGAGTSQQSNAGQTNFSGTWRLNREKSSWRGLRKPISVIVTIEHKQAAFSYSGSLVDADGELRNFEFSGFVDGKEHPATREYGEGKVALKWAGSNTLTATFKTSDGGWVETTTRSLSRNGKTLTQQLRLKAPDREVTWTEVYEKL